MVKATNRGGVSAAKIKKSPNCVLVGIGAGVASVALIATMGMFTKQTMHDMYEAQISAKPTTTISATTTTDQKQSMTEQNVSSDSSAKNSLDSVVDGNTPASSEDNASVNTDNSSQIEATVPVEGTESTQTSTDNSVEAIDSNSVVVKDESGNTYVYVIKWGDTLSKISLETGISVQKLAQLNDIDNVNLIYANSSLQIPKS